MRIFLLSIFSLLFLNLAASEDIYPNFSDMEKQLQFEERRIYIKEVNEKEMILSGGSQYNIFHLFDSNQPAIVPDDIETNYKYIYTFEILHNKKVLNEIEFLRLIGLEQKAEELENNFKNILQDYYANDFVLKEDNSEFWYALAGTLIGAMNLYGYHIDDDPELAFSSTKDKNEHLAINLILTGLGAFGMWYINENPPEPIKVYTVPKPVYKQQYTNMQLSSLAEAFNRKIYNDIKENRKYIPFPK